MGLFDQVVGAVAGQLGGQGGDNVIVKLVTQFIQNYPGGLNGLVEQFTRAGLGQQIQSWIGNGANLPVSGADLVKVFGGSGGELGQLISQFGLNHEEAMNGVAQKMPEIVNHLTPNGEVQQDALQQGLSALLGRLG